MAAPTIRPTTHSYPAQEIDVMNTFYGNGVLPLCCISQYHLTQWSHVLSASISASAPRLASMLARGLRRERNAAHPAELRENLIPLSGNIHPSFDSPCATTTLFLHEDVLARALAYELDLAKLRLEYIAAGRQDPGRPPYERVFNAIDDPALPGPITVHRCHSLLGVFHYTEKKFYEPAQCPGIPHDEPFPILRTLLSIPFSLIHTVPRLASMIPRTEYQNGVLAMGIAIINLWYWDPLPNPSVGVAVPVNADDVQWPPPVMDESRSLDTYDCWKSIPIPDCAKFSSSSDVPSRSHCPLRSPLTRYLPSGGIFLGEAEVSWDVKDGLFMAAPHENDLEPTKFPSLADTSNLDYCVNRCVSSSLSDDLEDGTTSIIAVEEKGSSVDVSQWWEQVLRSPQDNVTEDIIPSPYKQGTMAGMSTNDYLMAHGSIHPKVWLAFRDLSARTYLG